MRSKQNTWEPEWIDQLLITQMGAVSEVLGGAVNTRVLWSGACGHFLSLRQRHMKTSLEGILRGILKVHLIPRLSHPRTGSRNIRLTCPAASCIKYQFSSLINLLYCISSENTPSLFDSHTHRPPDVLEICSSLMEEHEGDVLNQKPKAVKHHDCQLNSS